MMSETKIEFENGNKDNVGIAIILAVSFFAVANGIWASKPESANQLTHTAVQKIDAIVVTASRMPDAVRGTIVLAASRTRHHN